MVKLTDSLRVNAPCVASVTDIGAVPAMKLPSGISGLAFRPLHSVSPAWIEPSRPEKIPSSSIVRHEKPRGS